MTETQDKSTQAAVKTITDLEAKVAKAESSVFGGRMTIVVLTMANGALVSGESCKDDEEGFNEEIGFDIAFSRAMEKAMMLETYAARSRTL